MMFAKASAIVTVSLALLSAAGPVGQKPAAKESSLSTKATHHHGKVTTSRAHKHLTKNGVFDKDKAHQETVRVKNKHRQNMLNLRKHGKLRKGQKIHKRAILPADVEERLERRRHRSNNHNSKAAVNSSEHLTDEQNDEEWAGQIKIGGQQFIIDFDTGSSDLWVPSSSCSSSTCSSKHKYKISKTASKKSGTFKIGYGDGSSVSGPVYTDTVSVAGITAKNQYFSPVTTLSSSFSGDPVDGILGLAFPAISNLGQAPFFNNANKQGATNANAFGFHLSQSNSELYLGGVDTSAFTGSLEYHTVDSSSGFWQISGASAYVGSKAAVSNFDTIIDSGTTIMYGPTSAVQNFYASVPGAKLFDQQNGYYSFPCSSVPSVSFSWGGTKWAISSANFNLGKTSNGASTCIGALAAQDLGLGDNVWLLGDSFMKNVYSAFDFDKNAVGFAALK